MNEQDKSAVTMFMNSLDVSEAVAGALVANGLRFLEELAYVPLDELLTIKDLEKDLLLDLRQKARAHLLPDDA